MWEDEFGRKLEIELSQAVSGLNDPAVLTSAVAACAAAAEAQCHDRPMACSAGCPHCCVLNVAALLPEVMVIAHFLRERVSPPELQSLLKRLDHHRGWARWMDDEERIMRQVFCPLLDEAGCCTVHQVRPLVCRAASSLNRASCSQAFNPLWTSEERAVDVDLVRQSMYDAAFTALAGLLSSNGLDDRSIELGTGLFAFLGSPQYIQDFLRGTRLPDALWR